MMKKLVILNSVNQITYVCPYDTNVYNNPLKCIDDYFKNQDMNVSLNNLFFMEVDDFVLVSFS